MRAEDDCHEYDDYIDRGLRSLWEKSMSKNYLLGIQGDWGVNEWLGGSGAMSGPRPGSSPGASTKDQILQLLREDERLALHYLNSPTSDDNPLAAVTKIALSSQLIHYFFDPPGTAQDFVIESLWRRSNCKAPWRAERYIVYARDGDMLCEPVLQGLGLFGEGIFQ